MDQWIDVANSMLLGFCICIGVFIWLELTSRSNLSEDQQFTPRQAIIRGGIFFAGLLIGAGSIMRGIVQILM